MVMTLTGKPQTSQIDKAPPELRDEDKSKDVFFERVGRLSEEMIAKHGKDFAMGVLVLAARFVADGRPLRKSESE